LIQFLDGLVQCLEKICRATIDSFDKGVLDFYDLEDRQRGYIHGEARQGEKVSFPIMTIAISVVTNHYCPLQNHIQVGEIAAELKSYAKSLFLQHLPEEGFKPRAVGSLIVIEDDNGDDSVWRSFKWQARHVNLVNSFKKNYLEGLFRTA